MLTDSCRFLWRSPSPSSLVYISGRLSCCIIHRMIRLIRWSDGAFTAITLATNKRPCSSLLPFIYLEGESKQMLGRPLSLIAVAADAYIFHDLRSKVCYHKRYASISFIFFQMNNNLFPVEFTSKEFFFHFGILHWLHSVGIVGHFQWW